MMPSALTRTDVAIYAPYSSGLYDRTIGRSGGAERQMVLLARALVEEGVRVAHIVYPVASRVPLPDGLGLVELEHDTSEAVRTRHVREAVRTWRALRRADPAVVIVRTGSPVVGLAAIFCRAYRRRLIFSSASDADFTFETVSEEAHRRGLYRLGVRLADAVVLQSDEQARLARLAFPQLARVLVIRSFAEPAPPSRGKRDLFLWVGRAVDYKRPELFLRLAVELPEARFVMVPVPTERRSPIGDRMLEEGRRHPNVEVRPPMSQREVGELMARSVAVVNTSTVEGMPNTFLEGWARGAPALTLDVDPDGIVSRHALGIAAEGSWERFVDGARQLWHERTNGKDRDARVRAYVRDEHSPAAVGRRWKALIDEVSRGPRLRGRP
jgi:glycosyltransferase involved in cell wall biosynthesis